MIHEIIALSDKYSFATIWIFARMIPADDLCTGTGCFATIWIFARMIQALPGGLYHVRFATIWIFARNMIMKKRRLSID